METIVLKDLLIHIIPISLIVVTAFLLNKLVRRALSTLESKSDDTTKVNFLKNSIGFIIYTIALILIVNSIPALKTLGTALFAGAGVMAAVIGFASQAAFSNIISGIFILIFKPFRIGDIIELQNSLRGKVTEITFRHTVIKDYENRRIIIPNSVISDDTIINSTIDDEKIRKHIHFGISYDADINLAMKIIREEIEKHPLFIDGRSKSEVKKNIPKIDVRVIAWADSSVNLRAYVWTLGADNAFLLESDVLKSIKEKFDDVGIEIPYPHHVVYTKK